jgi:hypothetical protein
VSEIAPEENVEQQALVAISEASKVADATTEVEVHDDRTREMKTPGFSRMRTEWGGPEGAHLRVLKSMADDQMLVLFPDAFVLMHDIYGLVREKITDSDGVVQEDQYGFPIYARRDGGAFIEDYSNLGIREREDFLFRITTSLFEWGQTRADLWGDAMFAKAIWEEQFATGFTQATGTGKQTIEDRTNRGRLASMEERYFAIFQSLLSRKADAVVSGMELIGQRLKDMLT